MISRSVFKQRWLDSEDGSVADGDATPPRAYMLQTLTEMMLNDSPWGVLAVLVASEFDWRLRLFGVERDPMIEERIYHCAETFWRDYLDANIMPPFEPLRDAELVKVLYPKDDGSEIDLTGDNRAIALVDEWTETTAAPPTLSKASDSAIRDRAAGQARRAHLWPSERWPPAIVETSASQSARRRGRGLPRAAAAQQEGR